MKEQLANSSSQGFWEKWEGRYKIGKGTSWVLAILMVLAAAISFYLFAANSQLCLFGGAIALGLQVMWYFGSRRGFMPREMSVFFIALLLAAWYRYNGEASYLTLIFMGIAASMAFVHTKLFTLLRWHCVGKKEMQLRLARHKNLQNARALMMQIQKALEKQPTEGFSLTFDKPGEAEEGCQSLL